MRFTYMYELLNLTLFYFKIELVVATYSRTIGDNTVIVRAFGCVM